MLSRRISNIKSSPHSHLAFVSWQSTTDYGLETGRLRPIQPPTQTHAHTVPYTVRHRLRRCAARGTALRMVLWRLWPSKGRQPCLHHICYKQQGTDHTIEHTRTVCCSQTSLTHAHQRIQSAQPALLMTLLCSQPRTSTASEFSDPLIHSHRCLYPILI